MRLQEAFNKAIAEDRGLTGKAIAVRLGKSQKNISETRTGQTSPRAADFDVMLDACEELSPGFKRRMACHWLEVEGFFSLHDLTPDDVAQILTLFADRYKAMSQKQPEEEELAIAA